MREYILTIYIGVKPRRVSFTGLMRALRYALHQTPKGDVWQLEYIKNGKRKYITRTHRGINR